MTHQGVIAQHGARSGESPLSACPLAGDVSVVVGAPAARRGRRRIIGCRRRRGVTGIAGIAIIRIAVGRSGKRRPQGERTKADPNSRAGPGAAGAPTTTPSRLQWAGRERALATLAPCWAITP